MKQMVANINNLMKKQDAAVQCKQLFLLSGIKFSLVNGTTPMTGRVQFTIDDIIGTVCGSYDDLFANVLCKELNYTSGRHLDRGTFSSINAKLQITRLNCNGGESRVTECPMKLSNAGETSYEFNSHARGPPNHCFYDDDDAAIQCYKSGVILNLHIIMYFRALQLALLHTCRLVPLYSCIDIFLLNCSTVSQFDTQFYMCFSATLHDHLWHLIALITLRYMQ
ncbi:hypothetical protein MAR_024742 [Mya arenaria]|uniref:SRCR domain-containing protein n=1 Tax=Mya arenaria TaxID=6604 RepID=A0ABY7DUR5_MYAAR|nr:hypothetical protein MAR_024742 [Mya arenaria]